MKKLLTLCLLVIATMSLSAKTLKEFVVTTQPQMSCQNCENKIKKNLRFEKGVSNITTDLENQVVVVTYDADKTNEENLKAAFAKLDYQVAPTTKANASAKAADKTCAKTGKACTGDHACKDAAAKDHACKDGKACAKDKACKDGKTCTKDKAAAEKKCDGKCDGKDCKKGDDCCKNKKK